MDDNRIGAEQMSRSQNYSLRMSDVLVAADAIFL